MTTRRQFLATALAGSAVASIPTRAFGAVAGSSPYGSIGTRDNSGVLLPAGFTARVIARSGQNVPGTNFNWRGAPDGAAVFPAAGGGWYHAVNHELSGSSGGVSVIEFDANANVVDAYSILSGTSRNCAGGPTPWGTWLSCEEVSSGEVYECDPTRPSQGVRRPALGVFNHEAVCVDPVGQVLFLTEDRSDGLLYRFVPDSYPSLTSGQLQAARLDTNGNVSWTNIPDPSASSTATRYQLSSSQRTRFNGGEGIWYSNNRVYFTTKGDDGVWEFDLVQNRITRIWGGGSPLTGVDNVTVEDGSGDVFVAEDGGNMEIVIIANGLVAPFARVPNQSGSEITGPCFSPDGTRMYFSSQRGTNGNGITYEITGPFRGASGNPPPPPPPPGPGLEGVWLLQNVQKGTYLEETSSNVIALTNSTGLSSQWEIVELSNGRLWLVNEATGRYLDGDGSGNRVGTSSSPALDDEWTPNELSPDVVTLKNAGANRWLDADNDNFVRLWNDENVDAQWRLVDPATAPAPSGPEGRWVLQNLQYGNVLTESSRNFIELTSGSTGARSEWDVVSIGGGLYHVVNVQTGRWLDSDGGGNVVGTSSSPASDDRWELVERSPGVYTLRNVSANRYLDADTDDRVRLWSDINNDARWVFIPA